MANDVRIELMYLIESTPDVSVEEGIFIADHLIANDVVQVVRCKECKHFGGYGKCYYHAADENGTPIFVCEDDFCSYGERREGE